MSFKTAFQKAAGPMAELVAHILVFILGAVALLGLEWLLELLIDVAKVHTNNILLVYVGEGLGDILLLTDVLLFVYLLYVSVIRAIKEISND
jgi:hypothetical protein